MFSPFAAQAELAPGLFKMVDWPSTNCVLISALESRPNAWQTYKWVSLAAACPSEDAYRCTGDVNYVWRNENREPLGATYSALDHIGSERPTLPKRLSDANLAHPPSAYERQCFHIPVQTRNLTRLIKSPRWPVRCQKYHRVSVRSIDQ